MAFSNAQLLHLLAAGEFKVKDHLRHKDRGKHVGKQSDHESDGEAAHLTRSEQEEDETGNDRSHVRVDNRPPRFPESRVDGCRN